VWSLHFYHFVLLIQVLNFLAEVQVRLYQYDRNRRPCRWPDTLISEFSINRPTLNPNLDFPIPHSYKPIQSFMTSNSIFSFIFSFYTCPRLNSHYYGKRNNFLSLTTVFWSFVPGFSKTTELHILDFLGLLGKLKYHQVLPLPKDIPRIDKVQSR